MPSVGRAYDMNSFNGFKPCRRRVWEHVPVYAGMGFTLLYYYADSYEN